MTEVDKARVKAELDRLEAAGNLTPAEVVSEASSPNSPLHDHFEWDDTEAAHNWRLRQARQLIKTVIVSVNYSPTGAVFVPAYVSEANANDAEHRHYSSVLTVMSDADRRRELVVATLGRALSVLRNCPEPTCQRLADRLAKELAKL